MNRLFIVLTILIVLFSTVLAFQSLKSVSKKDVVFLQEVMSTNDARSDRANTGTRSLASVMTDILQNQNGAPVEPKSQADIEKHGQLRDTFIQKIKELCTNACGLNDLNEMRASASVAENYLKENTEYSELYAEYAHQVVTRAIWLLNDPELGDYRAISGELLLKAHAILLLADRGRGNAQAITEKIKGRILPEDPLAERLSLQLEQFKTGF